MKFRVLFIAIALVAMTSLSFGATPAQVLYYYPGDWDHSSHDPLTYESCWTGTGIPLGSEDVLYVFIEGVEYAPYDFVDWGGLAGYFTMDYYAGGGVAVEGDVTYLEVRYEGCIYRTGEYILGPGAIDIPLYEADFVYCYCVNPGCEVIEEYSSE